MEMEKEMSQVFDRSAALKAFYFHLFSNATGQMSVEKFLYYHAHAETQQEGISKLCWIYAATPNGAVTAAQFHALTHVSPAHALDPLADPLALSKIEQLWELLGCEGTAVTVEDIWNHERAQEMLKQVSIGAFGNWAQALGMEDA